MGYKKKLKQCVMASTALAIVFCFGATATGAYAAAADSTGTQMQRAEDFPTPVATAQETIAGNTGAKSGYWRYFNYYYNDGMLFGVGWRERDNISRYSAKIHVTIDMADYPETNCQGLFNQVHKIFTDSTRRAGVLFPGPFLCLRLTSAESRSATYA